ncbi:unnamed protein product [Paramecium primaurelia]|uniref:BZIP domain-containing protein n=1 Tax=Paramecium primaurelia TaxID=5886 RepID=A0A8S1PSL8_PARPR|nr:unnamed protein product [Paramecium primaurelia]
MDSIQKKLAKNRESARNSRARKKLYYELMEIKVKQLQDEVKRLKENNCYQTNDNQFCNKNTENFQTFLDQQQLLFDKLENCILKNQDNFEISMILDELRQLTNQNNQNRNDAVRQYFDSMIEVCLPIQTKYLIYSIEQNKDFFALQSDDYTEWMKETFKKTKIQQDQIIEVKRMESKIMSIRNNISDSIQKIKDQLKLIQSETTQIDQIWEQLKECLTPIQLGTCILAIKQNSFRQELQTSSLFIQLNNIQMKQEDKKIQQFNQSPISNNNQLITKSIQ